MENVQNEREREQKRYKDNDKEGMRRTTEREGSERRVKGQEQLTNSTNNQLQVRALANIVMQ